MPAADTARLVAELTLKDKFTGPSAKVTGALGKMETGFDRIGAKATAGAKAFGRNVGLIGIAAAGGIAIAVKSGLDDLATLESAITSVDGAIAQMGLTGQVTGKQVAKWANDIEADIGAAFDDKDITQAATTLIRFGKVTTKNLQPALTVVADLATKTGDVESAASLLAKALADPAKAAGKLARTGVILTKAQQDQIKAMLEVNDVAGAQAVVLDAVSKATKGAAAASQGPYQRALSLLNDAAEDARKALAVGFLPVIEKVANRLSKAVGDPKFLAGIEAFGKTLAEGLDSLIDIAVKLPWQTIGDSLKIAGAGAKAVLQAFTSLPPWVQTAVITGWGLNKLTGGALGGIVGELGKGLIKGVLGINAGVVNINAATVNGGGGLPGVGAGGASAATITARTVAGGLLGVAGAAVIGGLIAEAVVTAVDPGDVAAIKAGAKPLANRDPRRFNQNGQVVQNFEPVTKKLDALKGQVSQASVRASERAEAIRAATVANGFHAQQASTGERAALSRINTAQQQTAARQAQAVSAIRDTRSETARVRSAIAAKKFTATVPVIIKNNISVHTLSQKQQIIKKFYFTGGAQ